MSDYICRNSGARHIRGRISPPFGRTIMVGTEITAHGTGWSIKEFKYKEVWDHYWVEVYNTRTDKIVYRGDAFGFQNAIALADRAVGVARWAWQMDLKTKGLK